eukprot:TRINITY_DN2246_c0_g1_i1.p1 TRINITY_DN2246_c0_g1~~TRINITY_DN2246_c0_g1_i1.p1  ORF type:complete len:230 (+),score=50.50 TRINITY_DN2246_c0_g1_i1:664-1353(+)
MSHHTDIINAVSIHGNNFVSSGKDGLICIWKMKDWECLKTLRGHTLGVNSFAIHPTGKIGLSCGVDRSLRVWNLINGRAAHNSKLTYSPEKILWSPEGDNYVITSFENVFIYNMEGQLLNTLTTEYYKPVLDIAFLDNNTIVFGGEDRALSVYTLDGELISYIEGFGNRIKGIATVPKPADRIDKFSSLIISISSDGFLNFFDLDIGLEPIAQMEIQNRLICLAAGSVN